MPPKRGEGGLENGSKSPFSSEYRGIHDITGVSKLGNRFVFAADMVRRLRPWHVNIAKRQVKSPKVYIRDSGLLHQLAGIQSKEALMVYPRMGASWEGFALEQVIRTTGTRDDDAFFWAVHQQGEIDLLVRDGRNLRAFEFKHTLAPVITKRTMEAMKSFALKELTVVYPGDVEIPLAKNINAVPLSKIEDPN